MYTFWFTANQAPEYRDLELGLFKPGADPSMIHVAQAPKCVSNCNGDVDGDGVINVADILGIVTAWGSHNANADVNDDGNVDVNDLLIVMANWGCE